MISHPQIIHFPIVFLFLAFCLELVNTIYKKEFLSRQSLVLLVGSLVGIVLSLITGRNAAISAESIPGIQDLLNYHENAGELLLYFVITLTIVKSLLIYLNKNSLQWRLVIIVLMFISIFQVYRTSHFGGQLVYEWGAGVKPVLEKYKLNKQEVPLKLPNQISNKDSLNKFYEN